MRQSSQASFWTPSAWYLAEVVHILAGAAVLLAAHLRGWDVGLTVGAFLTIAFVKEFLIDTSPFEGDTWWGSAQDFACYAIGVLAGWIVEPYFWAGVGVAGGTILVLFVIDLVRNADWSLTPYD